MAADSEWDTPYEKSGFQKTPRYPETVAFCQQLDEFSPWVHFTDFGRSPQGRRLPLLIVDRDGQFEPVAPSDRQKAVVLILAGIHAGEIDGKDAGLMLIRDLVVYKRHLQLLDQVTLLFIPIFNVDGHERFGPFNRINQNGPEEMGWRTTAQNLNLNRDFLKADAPEMRAFLKLFNQWLPDLLIDCHVTNGADYQYELTYIIDKSPLLPTPLRSWARDVLEPQFVQYMQAAQKLVFPYFWIRDRKNLQQGLIHPTLSPRFSTGYGSIQNRIFILLETHMLKPYKNRVEATYAALKSLLTIVNQQARTLLTLNRKADQQTAEQLIGRWLPLKFQVNTRDTTWVDFQGVDYQISRSDISGAKWIQYGDTPRTYRIPFFD
ncbi:MAG: M14 family metallopeptidase [Calditrichaeota bacterium]|nr:M14 family metallopeptidase [Calditrichota bacterium]